MYTVRADWEATPELSFGVQAKYVDQRFTTDVNDEVVPEYTTVDLDARYDLGDLVGFADTFVQLNITNVFDELYAVNISSGTNALTIADINPTSAVTSRSGSPRTFGIGAPRTALVTVGAKF
jgi:iron complex outermembrane receptor protein